MTPTMTTPRTGPMRDCGNKVRYYVGQSGGHGAASEHATDPEQGPGDIACERPKGGFDNTVDSTAGGDAAASLGKTNSHRSDREPTSQKRKRRIRADARCEGSGHCKDAGADDHAHNAGCEGPRPYCADQSDITLVFSHECHDNMHPGAKRTFVVGSYESTRNTCTSKDQPHGTQATIDHCTENETRLSPCRCRRDSLCAQRPRAELRSVLPQTILPVAAN